MVAISMYRGNLHRTEAEVPRRWLMPTPAISLKHFRSLLSRRSKALSLLPSSSSSSSSNPNPNPNPNPPEFNFKIPNSINVDVKMEDVIVVQPQLDQIDKSLPQLNDPPAPAPAPAPAVLGAQAQAQVVDENQKRKSEVEAQLHVLNEKKHNLVQALKQILNAEEELKRRSSVQTNRSSLPEASNDSASMTRHATPRPGSEPNLTVAIEGGEGIDAITINPSTRPLLRMSSTSPSAESALRKQPYFHHNIASHSSRAALVVSSSPSHFASSGIQGHPSNLPTVSVTGTNYFASSPSPAASGGTSGFRDARHPSPFG